MTISTSSSMAILALWSVAAVAGIGDVYSVAALIVAASAFGLLVFDFPTPWDRRVRSFMGDACSGFLGFTLGLLAIVTSTNGVMNIWSWLILFGVFVINIVWLLQFALLATKYPYWAAVICCVALFPLLLLAIRIGAGKREVEAAKTGASPMQSNTDVVN